MSKRFQTQGQLPGPPSKRRNIDQTVDTETEALELLLSHANELVDKIRLLQASQASQAKAIHGLRDISRKVLPSIQLLAEDHIPSPGCEQQEHNSASVKTCSAIPPPLVLPPFTLGDIPNPEHLPPLPEVLDVGLGEAALTHNGVNSNPQRNYERLEWLGDAYTEVISSSLLYQSFPNLEVGKLSQLRELLIKNTTLGKFAKQYGLMSRVKLPAALYQSKEKMVKVPGDILEAHVAAVILSDPDRGLQRLGGWLRAIFSTIIKDQIKREAREANSKHIAAKGNGQNTLSTEPSNVLPKVQLGTLIGAPGVNFRYEEDVKASKKDKYNPKLTTFSVNLFMDGWGQKNMWLGRGTDLSKKEAGQKAAQMALNNKSFIKSYAAKKDAWKAARDEGDKMG